MLSAIGDILPVAFVVASNPVIVIVMVLMLLSPGGKAASLGYLTGWVAGLMAVMSVVILLASFLDGDLPTFAVIEMLLGAGLIFLGWKQWKGRPKPGEEATLPSWMSAVDSMSPSRAFGLGLMLAAANPKNILLVASAAVLVAAADLRTSGVVVVVVVFILVATISIGGPFVAYVVWPDRVSEPLQHFRVWLVQNSATILAILFLVMGVTVIGKGIGLL